MFLFIDTNVLLSFFHFSNEDLDKLDQLLVLVERKQIDLLIPQQVFDEYTRNREVKIADALQTMIKEGKELPSHYAQICHQDAEYRELLRLRDLHDKTRAALLARVTEAGNEFAFHADKTISRLFHAGRSIPITPEILSAARTRHDLGNPPGKRGDSIGDAVNWEALLATCEHGSELHVVADDKDWQSPLDPTQFRPFLYQEWRGRMAAPVRYYQRLTAFVAQHFPDLQLAGELEKDLLIQELADSRNFRGTHNIIRFLSHYSDFTPAQVNDIVSAYLSNLQVGGIATDSDVRQFIESTIAGHEGDIDPADLADLRAILSGEHPATVQLRRLVGPTDH